MKPHPFIDEFIPTVDEINGICYTHPQKLPGVKQDGSVSHFFHRAIKAYNTGTRKRRKIHGDDFGDLRWHKTGRTKPVFLDGVQQGCKKIMVLYVTLVRGGKAEKTNWVMHQYHLGTGEDEKEGEYVISKVFYQQQQGKQADKLEQDFPEDCDVLITKVDPVTPKSFTPEPPRAEKQFSDFDTGHQSTMNGKDHSPQHHETGNVKDEFLASYGKPNNQDTMLAENHDNHMADKNENQTGEDPKWWDNESQYLLDSQQLVEGLSLCDDLLQSQSPNRDRTEIREPSDKPQLSDYTQLGPEDLKDLEDSQNVVLNPANIEVDTPPDFRLSQLEFASQESFLAWGGSKAVD